jgi:hypothetical protein
MNDITKGNVPHAIRLGHLNYFLYLKKCSDPDEPFLWLSIKVNSRITESYNYDYTKIYTIISGKIIELIIRVKVCSLLTL